MPEPAFEYETRPPETLAPAMIRSLSSLREMITLVLALTEDHRRQEALHRLLSLLRIAQDRLAEQEPYIMSVVERAIRSVAERTETPEGESHGL